MKKLYPVALRFMKPYIQLNICITVEQQSKYKFGFFFPLFLDQCMERSLPCLFVQCVDIKITSVQHSHQILMLETDKVLHEYCMLCIISNLVTVNSMCALTM